jgi:peptide/nickel transport system substrate-binding protein
MTQNNRFRNGLTRRQFLRGSTAFAFTALTLPVLPNVSYSAESNILKIRDYGDFLGLDPCFSAIVLEENIMGTIYNKLISYKPGEKWETQLEAAESIEQVDTTHIKFKLKPGILFTNNFGEMTAEDVKFSFERIIDPANNSPVKGDWATLDHVEVTDKYSGVIVLKSPFQPLMNSTLPYIGGNIVSKKAVESVGGKFTTKPPCSSGPYFLKEWKPKQLTVLARNELWKGPKAAFDEIHIFPIDDEKTAEIAFEAGDIDFTRISIPSYNKYKQNPPANSTVINRPSLYYVWLGMMVENPKFKDIRVRKAIQMAVDVPSVLEAAYFGVAEPATGFIPPGLLGYREKTLVPPEANVEGAKKLLAEAGYSKGLTLTLDVLNKAVNNTAAQVIQANLAQIGVKVQINQHESGAFWTLGSEKDGDRWKNIELILIRYSGAPDPIWATQWFVTEQKGIWNWERFSSAEYDELYKNALGEADPVKRDKMYQKMQDLLEESGAYRFLTHEATPIMYRNTIIPALRPDGVPLMRHFKKA